MMTARKACWTGQDRTGHHQSWRVVDTGETGFGNSILELLSLGILVSSPVEQFSTDPVIHLLLLSPFPVNLREVRICNA